MNLAKLTSIGHIFVAHPGRNHVLFWLQCDLFYISAGWQDNYCRYLKRDHAVKNQVFTFTLGELVKRLDCDFKDLFLN